MLKNLTPHDIHLVLADESIRTVPRDPNAVIPRVAATTETIGEIEGIPIVRLTWGAAQDLPPVEEGTVYVVSALLRDAVPERTDFVSPGDMVRDPEGRIVGCRSLARIK